MIGSDFMRIRQHIGNVDIQLNTDRIDRNIREAQKLLNMQVVADCDPLIPFQVEIETEWNLKVKNIDLSGIPHDVEIETEWN